MNIFPTGNVTGFITKIKFLIQLFDKKKKSIFPCMVNSDEVKMSNLLISLKVSLTQSE